MSEVQILSPRLFINNLVRSQHQTGFLFFVLGALLALWSLFAPLPVFFVDLIGCLALAAGASSLAYPISTLPGLLVSLAVLRVGLGLALLRASLSGVVGLTGVLGGSLPGVAGVVLVASAALILGLFLAKAASRAAEVSARFALDALPGSQAALDAAPRSLSDPLQNNRSREQLLSETRWKGSADGAAKLLSGDALLAPIFGALAALAPLAQGQELALSQGVGVSLLLLAAALPPAAALAFGVVSSDTRRAPGSLFGAAAMVPLLFSSLSLAPLLLLIGCVSLYIFRPKTAPLTSFILSMPEQSQRDWQSFSREFEASAGFHLPAITIERAVNDEITLRSKHALLAKSNSLQEVFEEAAPLLFSMEEAQQVIQSIAARFPVSASLMQTPLKILHQAMRQLLVDRLPLDLKILAEVLSTSSASATEAELSEKIRVSLRPTLLQQIGAPPCATLRLEGLIEEELRQRRPLDPDMLLQLKTHQRDLEQSNPNRSIVVLCHRDARSALSSMLRRNGWVFLVSDELPAEVEIDFLGELGAV